MQIGKWREVDTLTAARTLYGSGYTGVRWGLEDAGRNVPLTVEGLELHAPGHTHAKTAPNDHYWRLVTAQGKWFFKFTDVSHRWECQCGDCK